MKSICSDFSIWGNFFYSRVAKGHQNVSYLAAIGRPRNLVFPLYEAFCTGFWNPGAPILIKQV